MKKLLITTFFTLSLYTQATLANPAFEAPAEKARAAAELIQTKQTVKLYCKPCGDLKATTEYINKVELKQSDFKDYKHNNYMTLYINDKAVDLNAVYIQKGGLFGKKWVNIGSLVKYKTREDVDDKLDKKHQ